MKEHMKRAASMALDVVCIAVSFLKHPISCGWYENGRWHAPTTVGVADQAQHVVDFGAEVADRIRYRLR